jgi:hypothetical protein
MPILGIPEASHFCAGYQARPGPATGSFRQQYGILASGRTYAEGTATFDDFRACALREVERLLFLGISNYRRSFDLLTPAASTWAHVTMYYASYYCAASLMGMFGAWKLRSNRVLDVSNGSPGSQTFVTRSFPSSYAGSHQKFWEFFYANVSSLNTWVDPSLRFALTPMSGTVTWLIDQRNDVNYDTHIACNLVATFQSGFRRTRFPTSLPGVINTQFRLTEALVTITAKFAKQFKIHTDALAAVTPAGKRKAKVRECVLAAATPNMARAIKRRMLLA